jgi:hypothetical protein
MRASFEIVSRNQPSYRPRITRIESVPPTLKRIAVFGELVRLYNAPPPARTERSQCVRINPVVRRATATASKASLFARSPIPEFRRRCRPPRIAPWIPVDPGTHKAPRYKRTEGSESLRPTRLDPQHPR